MSAFGAKEQSSESAPPARREPIKLPKSAEPPPPPVREPEPEPEPVSHFLICFLII